MRCKFCNKFSKNYARWRNFIPKLPAIKIIDLAKAIDEKRQIKMIGLRESEKIMSRLSLQMKIKMF